MAAWVPKSAVRVSKSHNVCAATYGIQQTRECSSKPRIVKNPTTASLKRGTGGRSSFNGIVCTVFGSNGFIGGYVCNRLGKVGTQLILPHRRDPYDLLPLKLCGDLGQVLFHPFSLRDEESIIKSIKYSNVVINLIGKDFETKNYTLEDVHVEGPRKLARLSRECGVERFIHVSALNASEDPEPLIRRSGPRLMKLKWQGECAVKEEFPNATIVRPSDVYGQEDKFLNQYMHSWRRQALYIPLWEGGEKTEKQPVFVGDVAGGIAAIAQDPRTAGKTYQFVGPKRYKLAELIRWFYKLTAYDLDQTDFTIIDMKQTPLFKWKIEFSENLAPPHLRQYLNWECLEKTQMSDKVINALPTLEDLGINLTDMESQVPWELKLYRRQSAYVLSLGELIKAPAPKEIPLH